jgi:hypothetical protein
MAAHVNRVRSTGFSRKESERFAEWILAIKLDNCRLAPSLATGLGAVSETQL